MTLPLQVFRLSADYAFSAAGANPTPSEVLAAWNSMLGTEAGLGSNWGVSAYSAGANNTLEVKRLGSPSSPLNAVRGLILGGTNAPNAAALGNGVTASVNTLYAGIAENAGSGQAGPDASYVAGAPYTTTTSKKWSGAGQCMNSSALVAAGGLRVFMIDCDRGCALFAADSTNMVSVFIGGWAERLSDNTEIFLCMTGGGAPQNQATYAAISTSSHWLVPGNDILAFATNALCGWHDGVNQQALFRVMVTGRASDSLLGNNRGTLVPIVMSNRVQTGAADSSSEFGVLRQLRYGPYCNNITTVADASFAVTCYGVSSGKSTLRAGIYFDANQ